MGMVPLPRQSISPMASQSSHYRMLYISCTSQQYSFALGNRICVMSKIPLSIAKVAIPKIFMEAASFELCLRIWRFCDGVNGLQLDIGSSNELQIVIYKSFS